MKNNKNIYYSTLQKIRFFYISLVKNALNIICDFFNPRSPSVVEKLINNVF